jgi:uncharacterized protein YkwD
MERKQGCIGQHNQKLIAVLTLLTVMFVSFAGTLQVEAGNSSAAMYASIFDAKFYAQKYQDLVAVFGTDENALLAHFLTNGMVEGRQGCAEFNVQYYMAKYPDLRAAYGDQLPFYYMHYMSAGKLEGRQGNGTISNNTSQAAPAATTSVTQPAASAGNSEVDQVIALCNQARAQAGLSPLTKSEALCSVSVIRSNELVRSFSHNRPDGRSCFTIYNENGISYGYAGENIAAGQHSAQEVVNAWLNSPGHRRNIMNANYHKIGVGLVIQQGTIYEYYWTQMFTD